MWSQEKYRKALDFAARVHGKQEVPGKPYSYIVHLSNVCMEVLAALFFNSSLDADLAVQCALLHDTVEDTATSPAELEKEFGSRVARGVLALSKNKNLPKNEQLRDSLERIRKEPVEVGMVKLADRITNLQPPPPHWSAEKIAAYKAEAKEILAALKHCNTLLAARLEEQIGLYGK